jgi:hypothetical protein
VARYAGLGTSFDIVTDDDVLEGRIVRMFAALRDDAESPAANTLEIRVRAGEFELWRDDSLVAVEASRPAIMMQLLHASNRLVIEQTDLLAIHAGAVEHDGVGIVLPGVMGAGKTTITAGLLRAGCAYLSDEAAAFDPTSLHLQPFPKPLSIDPESWTLFPEVAPSDDEAHPAQWQVPVADFAAVVGTPCSARLIVFPRYDVSVETSMRAITRGEALVQLANNTFDFSERSRWSLDRLAAIVAGASCYHLDASDLDESVAAIMAVVAP